MTRLGFKVSDGEALQNLRFADDILVVGRSLAQVQAMLEDISIAAGEIGLKLHLGKTKILKNGIGKYVAQRTAKVQQGEVEIPHAWGCTTYLGKDLSLHQMHEVELDSRIAKAWRKLYTIRNTLCDRCHSLKVRFKLFETVVTPTMLYGCGTWTSTRDQLRKIRFHTAENVETDHGYSLAPRW